MDCEDRRLILPRLQPGVSRKFTNDEPFQRFSRYKLIAGAVKVILETVKTVAATSVSSDPQAKAWGE